MMSETSRGIGYLSKVPYNYLKKRVILLPFFNYYNVKAIFLQRESSFLQRQRPFLQLRK